MVGWVQGRDKSQQLVGGRLLEIKNLPKLFNAAVSFWFESDSCRKSEFRLGIRFFGWPRNPQPVELLR